ncbi:MAG: alpha/beta hydrolase [Patescibacteria group bacterium]
MKILFIQGAGTNAYIEDKKLADNLQELLGPSYTVIYPKMPHEEAPDFEPWKTAIQEELNAVKNEEIILVGHSLGGSVLVKFLSENKIDTTLSGVFIISAPFWGGDTDWQAEVFTPSADFPTMLPTVPFYFYQAKDDEIVPFAHLEMYKNKLPNSTVREIKTGGHQLDNDLSLIAADIEELNK